MITLALFFNNQYSILIFMIKMLLFEYNSITCMDPFEIERMLFQNDVAEIFHYINNIELGQHIGGDM